MTELKVNDLDPRAQYAVGNVPQNNFAVPFPFFLDSDLKVIKTVNETNTDLTLANDYTVTGAGTSEGGTVLLTLPVTNCIVTIKRVLPLKRTSDFPAVGPFPIQALNDDLAKLVMMIQQVASSLGRTIRMSDDDPFTGLELPPPSQRANKSLVFDATGAAKVSDENFANVVTQAQAAVAQATLLAQQIEQKIAEANALLQQAQSSNLLPAATVPDAGRPVVVTGDNSFGLGNATADKTLGNVTNADFATKAAAAGVGGGGGGVGNPLIVAALYGGSY